MTQPIQPESPFARLIATQNRPRQAAQPPAAVPATPAAAEPPQQGPAAPATAHPLDQQPPTDQLAGSPAVVTEPGTADAPAAAVGEETKRTIAVLLSTGGYRTDEMFAGSVGTLDDNECFQFDPDYRQLSYLFSLTSGSALPAIQPGREVAADESGEIRVRVGEKVMCVELPASAAEALRMNLVAMSSGLWSGLYTAEISRQPAGSMIANALCAERDAVSGAVTKYLADKGLGTWDAPVVYAAAVHEESPDARPRTEEGLLAAATSHRNMTPDVTGTPTAGATAAPAGTAVGPNEAEAAEAPAATVLPDAWTNHKGPLELTIEGTIPVQARDAEQAKVVCAALLMCAQASPIIGRALKPRPLSIQGVQLLEPTESDDDDSYDRYR